MRKFLLLMIALLAGVSGAWAESFYFLTTQTQVTSITSGKYYVIDGLNQVGTGTAGHFLFDNGTKVTSNNPGALPTDPAEVGKYIWQIVGNSTDGYTLQNMATGHYMSLGGSNGSQISASSTPQTNGIYFGVVDEVTYATIHNSNGQSIDIGAYGDNPTTWSGSETPGGSRRLVIYEVEPVEITDGACYTMTFQAKTSGNTWGLRAGTSGATPDASGAGDVFVAHSYTNASGNRRWIFVKNSGTDAGAYLAYSGSANAAFDISNAISEWDIAKLTAGSGYVSADANVAGKLCITNDKRYTGNSSKGCYIVNESNGGYAASDAPYLNGSYTSALVFTATGDAVSSAASLAIAKFEALNEVKSYLTYAGNISALFADPSSIEANINAAATAEAAATIATNFMKSPEGKKFYAVNAGVAGQYLSIGESYVTGTSTSLTPADVMEVEYAGGGRYYLKGVKYATYACTPGSSASISTTSTQGSAETFFIVNRNNDTDNKVYFSNKTTSGNQGAIHYSGSYTYKVVGWTWNSDNSQWNITAVSDAEYTELCNTSCDVTYNAIMVASGDVKATATVYDAIRGSALALPSALARDYTTVTFYSDAACTEAITTVPSAATATVYALVTYTPPFTLSSSYENATWYYATLRSKYVRADENAKDGSGRYTTNTTNEKTDVYKWAFVGTNPYDLTIMNRGAGSSKYLYAGNVPVMQEATPASDNKARWVVSPNTTGGFSVRSESGATMYINDAGNGGNLGYWNSSWGANDGGSNWVITEVPTVDVTYEMWDGEEKVNTIVVNGVPEYAEVDVPASLTTGYTTFAYDFVTSGTIGNADCAITVTATLKSGLVKVGDLSNTKKYKITSARGSLSTYTDGETTYLASPVKTSLAIEGKDFAILKHANKYYLYSVDDEQFVTYLSALQAPLADNVTGTSDQISFQETSKSVYLIKFNNEATKYINSSATYTYGIAINDWGSYTSDYDDGNQYVLEEDGDFDPKDALGILTGFNNIIANLKTINWSDVGEAGQLNRYNFIGDFLGFAGNEMALIETMEQNGYSDEAYSAAQAMNSKGVGYALNLPAAGKFYRIQGYSGNYMTSNTASSNASMNGTASANNIVYYSADQNLIFFGSGYGLYDTSIVAPAGSTLNAYTFSEGAQSSHYYVKSDASGIGTYCYDNTSNGTKLDRNTSPVTSGSYQTDWTLEEITILPVAISAAGYATLYSPVALTIPAGVTAYVASDEGEYLHLTAIEGDIIPANTGVILAGTAGTYDFAITTGGSVDSNVLTGTVAAIARPGDSYILATGSAGVGFYKDGASTIPGFKAYLPAAGGSSVKAFRFDSADAIESIVNDQLTKDNAAIYNLAGQRISKLQKGINIVNGKKVLVK